MRYAANAAIAWRNLADRASLSASSAATFTPPTLLQNPHVARKMRFGAPTGQHVVADLGEAMEVDTVALFGLNLTAAGTIRVRASLDDTSGQGGEAYDSDPVTGRVDPAYAAMIDLAPEPFTARYVRVDLSDAALEMLEAGRLFIGKREAFEHNFAFGWQRSWVDRSRRTESRGGQTYIDRDNAYRVVDLTFEALSREERYGLVEDIDRENGTHTDVLLLTDPSSANLGRDSLWGLMSELTPAAEVAMWLGDTPGFSKTYRIRERL